MLIQHLRHVVSVCALWLVTSPIGAQRPYSAPPPFTGHSSFAIAVVEAWPYRNAEAVILRRVNGTPQDLILVKKSKVTAALLADAVENLRVARAAHGDQPAADMLLRVRKPATTAKHLTEAAEWVARLNRNRTMRIDLVGAVPVVQLYLPNQHGMTQ